MKLSTLETRRGLGVRALLFSATALVVAWPFTIGPGLVAAVGSACGATWCAHRVAISRLRTLPALLLSALVAATGLSLAHALANTLTPARALGPMSTLALEEIVLWTVMIGPIIFSLRLLGARFQAAAVLEVVAVGGAFAVSLAAHRNGAYHRPYVLGDWAWTRGIDPAWVLLVLGSIVTLLLAVLLVQERRSRRLPLHLATVALIALGFLLLIDIKGLPEPKPANELDLTGDPREGEGDEGRGDPGDQMGELEFRDEYGNSGNEAPVAVVLMHDDWTPPSGVFYFRQSAFSQYNGRRLVASTRDDVDGDLVTRFPTTPLEVPVQPPESKARRPLRTTTGLLVDHVRPFALDAPVLLTPIRNPDPKRFQRAFDVLSRVRDIPYEDMIGRLPGNADWNREQWQYYTESPSDARYEELARDLVSVLRAEYADDPLAQALAIKSYLDLEGIYSRKSQHAGADDPTGSFLFGDRTGYCVHFAHAATYLLRSLGLPARVAAGYAVADASRAGSSAIMIRGLNAHAWPELYLEGLGWVVVDLAPQQSLDEATQPADPNLQRMLGEMLRQPSDAIDDPARRQHLDLAAVGRFLMRLTLLALVTGYLVKLWRRVAPELASAEDLPRLGYRAVLDQLAEVGWRRRSGESRESFARRLEGSLPSFPDLTRTHVAVALGSRSASLERVEWRRVRRTLTEEVRQSRPTWRRVLGIFDPAAWLRAR